MKAKYILGLSLFGVFTSCGTPAAVSSTTTTQIEKEEKIKPTEGVPTAPQRETRQLVMTKELTEGKDLYEKYCTSCHRMFEAKEFGKDEWPSIFVQMQEKAHLSNSQMASISNYIYAQL